MVIFTRTFDLLTWFLPATNHFPRAHPNEGGGPVGQVTDLPVAAFSEGQHGGGEGAEGQDSVGPEAPGTGRPEVRPTGESLHAEMLPPSSGAFPTGPFAWTVEWIASLIGKVTRVLCLAWEERPPSPQPSPARERESVRLRDP